MRHQREVALRKAPIRGMRHGGKLQDLDRERTELIRHVGDLCAVRAPGAHLFDPRIIECLSGGGSDGREHVDGVQVDGAGRIGVEHEPRAGRVPAWTSMEHPAGGGNDQDRRPDGGRCVREIRGERELLHPDLGECEAPVAPRVGEKSPVRAPGTVEEGMLARRVLADRQAPPGDDDPAQRRIVPKPDLPKRFAAREEAPRRVGNPPLQRPFGGAELFGARTERRLLHAACQGSGFRLLGPPEERPAWARNEPNGQDEKRRDAIRRSESFG